MIEALLEKKGKGKKGNQKSSGEVRQKDGSGPWQKGTRTKGKEKGNTAVRLKQGERENWGSK